MKQRNNRKFSHRSLRLETLENREFLSATPFNATATDSALLSVETAISVAQAAPGKIDLDVPFATNNDANLTVLPEQDMLEYAYSGAVAEGSTDFSPETRKILNDLAKKGWTAGSRWFYYDDGMYDTDDAGNFLNWDSAKQKLNTDGPLCRTIDRANELGLNSMVWKCEVDNCFDRAYLAWSRISGAQSYRVSQSTDGGKTYVSVMSGISELEYNVPILKSDAVYTFKVDALGKNGKPLNTSYVGTLDPSTKATTTAAPNAFEITLIEDERITFLKQVQSYAEKRGIEIIPTVWFTGCNAYLSQDATLVEGKLVEKAPLNVNGTTESVEATVYSDGFEGSCSNSVPLGWQKTNPSPELGNYVKKTSGENGGSSVLVTLPKSNSSDGIRRDYTGLEDGYYRVACKVKISGSDYAELTIQDVDNPGNNAYTDYKQGNDNYVQGRWGKMTTDVVRVSSGKLEVQLSGAGTAGSKIWFDDVEIIRTDSPDFLPIPREGTPIKVFKKISNDKYVEIPQTSDNGVVNWKLPDGYRESYKFEYGEGFYVQFGNGEKLKSIDLEIPANSQIRSENLDTIYVDYYAPEGNQHSFSRYSVCLSEEKLYDLTTTSAAIVQQTLHPKTWFIAFDEVTIGGTCETCQTSGLTTAQIFGKSVSLQCDIIRKTEGVAPNVDIVVWSDMFDPNHNAKASYEDVNGSLEDVVEYIPNDLIIACWYDETDPSKMTSDVVRAHANDTLTFFSQRGFRTISSCYFDWVKGRFSDGSMPTTDLDFNTRGWLGATVDSNAALCGNLGVFYVTWPEANEDGDNRDYRYLDPLGEALNQVKDLKNAKKITSISLDADAPIVGQTVTATIPDAADASTAATYQWYRLEYVCDDEDNWAIWKKIDGATNATYAVQTADLNKELKVVAVGVGEYAGTASATSQSVAIGDITVVIHDSATRQALIKWNAIPGAVTYNLKISKDGGKTWTTYAKNFTNNYKSINGLYAGKSYGFRVYGVDANGNPIQSPLERTFAPIALKSSTETYTVGKAIKINKTASSEASATIKWYYATPSGDVEITAARGKLTYTPTSGSYDIKVVATGTGVSKGSSSTLTFKKSAPSIGDITVVRYDSTTREALIKWNAIPDAATYNLEISKDGGKTWTTYAKNFSNNYKSVNGLYVGQSYGFRVFGIDASGRTLPDYNEGTFTPSVNTVSSVTFDYDAATRKATVSWASISGATTYKVQLSKNNGETWPNYKTGVTTTSIEANGLYAGKTYRFRIYGVAANGTVLPTPHEASFSPRNESSLVLDEAFANFFEEDIFEEI